MSTASAGLPAATARAVAVVGIVVAVAVAALEPIVGAGALAGGIVAVGVLGVGASRPRQFVGAAAIVPSVAGSLGALWLATTAGVDAVALAVPVVVLGGSIVLAFAGGLPAAAVSRAPATGLYLALATGAVAVGLVALAEGRPLAVAWFATTSVGSLAGATLFVGALVVASTFAIPVGSLATPATSEAVRSARHSLAVVAGALVGTVAVAFVLAPIFDTTDALVATLAEQTSVRVLLAAVGLTALGLLAVGGFVRLTHGVAGFTGGEHVVVFAGGALGAGLTSTALFAAVDSLGVASITGAGGPGPATAAASLLGVTAVACLAGAVAATTYQTWLSAGTAPGASTAIALASLVVGLAVGATRAAGWSPTPRGAHVVALVAITAGLVAYRAGRVGRDLAGSVGATQATRRPQLVHVGWSSAVAGVGLAVAGGGYWLATAIAPTLSVPATVGAVGGLAAVGAAAWLLLR